MVSGRLGCFFFSAEMCADALVSGCQCSYRFLPQVSFLVAETFSLASLGFPLRHPGGPWDDPRAPRSTTKDTLKSRLDYYRFEVDFDTPFLELFGCCGAAYIFLFMHVSRLFLYEAFCWGLDVEAPKTGIWQTRGCKNQLLPDVWILMI